MDKVDIKFGKQKDQTTYIDREAVYGVLIEDNKILVVQTPRGYFLPGGGIEKNETHQECLKREMLEETGLEVDISSYIGKSVLYDKSPRDNIYYNMFGNFYTVVKIGEKEKTESDHFIEYLSVDEAIEKLKLVHQVWAIKRIKLHQKFN